MATALRQALELIKRNVEEYDIDCGYKELPGYLYARDEKENKELDAIFLKDHKKPVVEVAYCTGRADKNPI